MFRGPFLPLLTLRETCKAQLKSSFHDSLGPLPVYTRIPPRAPPMLFFPRYVDNLEMNKVPA